MKWLFIIFLFLAGCMTPYQSMGLAGGYEDQSLGDDKYMIIVKVNGFTDASTAYKYFHRRAQEIVEENGYKRYEVIEMESSTKTRVSTKKDGGIVMSHKPRYFGRIVCFRD